MVIYLENEWLYTARMDYCKDFSITPSDQIADCTRSGIRIEQP